MNDAGVRRAIYDRALTTGQVPSIATIAADTGSDAASVRAGLQRLAEAHVLVLQADGEILMAAPFSAVPTAFVVAAGDIRAFGNCVWDAFGILAMLHRDGVVETACGCCGVAMTVRVAADTLRDGEGIVHYSVPAKQWWDNIVFT